MDPSLAGQVIAVAEGRQLEELINLLQKEGATALRYPLLSILDVPDPEPVLAWLRKLVRDEFGLLILFTGEGVRRLLDLAERHQFRPEVVEALGRVPLLIRGPKPVRALKEAGLDRPWRIASPPTTNGVISCLGEQNLQGVTVGVQLYNDSNTPLMDYLTAAGALVEAVTPYIYAPQADSERVVELIQKLSRGEIDTIIFTSSSQVDRLFEVARDQKQEAELFQGLARTCVAAVGPLVADSLHRHAAPVTLCPEQGWVMKNLVQQIKKVQSGKGNPRS